MKAIFGGKLIVPDSRGGFRVLYEHALLYDKNVERVVPEAELSADDRDGFAERIDADNAFVSPGFVNIHIHGAMGFDAMDDDAFDIYLRYHFATCELPELVGWSHHTLDIFEKLKDKSGKLKFGWALPIPI